MEIIKDIYNEYTSLINNFFGKKSKETIKNNSQYFTPFNEADKLLEDLLLLKKEHIRILDPAVGGGILVIKLLEKILTSTPIPKTITIDAYDIDESTLNILKILFENKYFNSANIILNTHNVDFLIAKIVYKYDYIVQNPPYKKINQKDVPTELLNFVNGQPNLYHIFIAKSLTLLNENGTLCILSPKNFLSGKYTESLRKYILDEFSITKIHTFDDRRNIFENDVIQEVCITHISKRKEDFIKISHNGTFEKIINKDELIINNNTNIVLTPHSEEDFITYKKFKIFPFSTIGKDILLKTGIVVQFRVPYKDINLVEEEFSNFENGVPLIVYRHINKNYFSYGNLEGKSKNKAITLLKTEQTKQLLIPNNNYVFIRKSTDKKYDKLFQSVLYNKELKTDYLALDNSIAYFTNNDNSLFYKDILGIHCVLKSRQFDNYYRMLNSSHTINVYELENMYFPHPDTLKIIGKKFKSTDKSIDSATKIMEEFLS